jgi:hypothetical protein
MHKLGQAKYGRLGSCCLLPAVCARYQTGQDSRACWSCRSCVGALGAGPLSVCLCRQPPQQLAETSSDGQRAGGHAGRWWWADRWWACSRSCPCSWLAQQLAPGPRRQVAAAAQAPAPGQQAVQCHGSRQQGSLIAGMPPASSAPSGEPGASRPAGDCWHQSLAPPSGGLAHAAAAGWLPAAGASCPARLTCQPLEQD